MTNDAQNKQESTFVINKEGAGNANSLVMFKFSLARGDKKVTLIFHSPFTGSL